MADVSTYGRSRQSIADLEQELYDLFQDHPESHLNDEDQPVIPGNALVDVLRTFSHNHDAVELMTPAEESQLTAVIESNPGLAVTPQVLLKFIAMRTTSSPTKNSPEGSPPHEGADLDERGRTDERDYGYAHSRSSSTDSNGTSIYRAPSRGPSVPPKTPTSRESPFDMRNRQRTAMLGNTAPSSWARRPPPSRRKSDASSHSRSDSESTDTSSWHTPGRRRAPSNPTSPTASSPPYGYSISRPHSRAQSQPQSHFGSLDGTLEGYRNRESPERDHDFHSYPNSTGLMSPPPSDQSDLSFEEDDDQFADKISSMLMPRSSGSDDDDSDRDDDSVLGLIMDRSVASSTASLDVQERLDALQRLNTDLGRKLLEAEKTLQKKLAEHELELEEMQSRLEEVKSELSATKREEKELRSKERTNQNQISALESEIGKLQKSLETARASYQSLQKQYQEQCTESERYRNVLRRRDQEIKDLQEAGNLASLEASKWVREQSNYEERIAFLESELVIAQQAQAHLEEQKQENMILKETIDRMRFDMDEMRVAAASVHTPQGGPGTNSARGSVSKSLGAELLSKMKDANWDLEDEEDEGEVEGELDFDGEGEDTEGEDVVETIITRTKRKVASRAKRMETIKVEEIKEYSDTATQHDMSEFTTSCDIQTDPEPKILTASFSMQTEEPPIFSMSIQTDPEPELEVEVKHTVDAEIQTDEPEPVVSTSFSVQVSEDDEETLASSSSTLLPPTPRAQPEELHPHTHDLPPDYNQVTGQDRDELARRVADETLKKWHKGLRLPIEPVRGGISEDAVEDWKALKEELGVECSAIDRIVEESVHTGLHRPPRSDDGDATEDGAGRRGRRRSRFYNIYNTYVYGDPDGRAAMSTSQFLFCMGASAAFAFLVGQAMAPQSSVPGGATYYDRAAWSSFNSIQATGEGFPGDGTAAVLGFLGRLGGGAARTLRGWPT